MDIRLFWVRGMVCQIVFSLVALKIIAEPRAASLWPITGRQGANRPITAPKPNTAKGQSLGFPES
jgi:hypothetical protein